MSVTTIEGSISAKIAERLKTQGNPNTTFLVDGIVKNSKTDRQNSVADEVAKDTAFTSRKLTAVPTAFNTNDTAICTSDGIQELKANGVMGKLSFNADVRYIVFYGPSVFKDSVENFTEISTDKLKVGTDRNNSAFSRVQVFKRVKVNIA